MQNFVLQDIQRKQARIVKIGMAIWAIWIVFVLSVIAGLTWVAVHFISKLW